MPREALRVALAVLLCIGFVLSEPARLVDRAVAKACYRLSPDRRNSVRLVLCPPGPDGDRLMADTAAALIQKKVKHILLELPNGFSRSPHLQRIAAAPELIWITGEKAEGQLRTCTMRARILEGQDQLREGDAVGPLYRILDPRAAAAFEERLFFIEIPPEKFPVVRSTEIDRADWSGVEVCVVSFEGSNRPKYLTPGLKTSDDYIATACRSVLSGRYLFFFPLWAHLAAALVAFACLYHWERRHPCRRFCSLRGLPARMPALPVSKAFPGDSVRLRPRWPRALPCIAFLCAVSAVMAGRAHLLLPLGAAAGGALAFYLYRSLGPAPPASSPKRAAETRAAGFAVWGATALGAATLAAGFAWLHVLPPPEQGCAVLCAGLLVLWAGISRLASDRDREAIELRLLAAFAALATAMALFPDLLPPRGAEAVQPAYRGILRWKGWAYDSNNAGLACALAVGAICVLWRRVPARFRLLLLSAGALLALQLVRSYSRIGLLCLGLILLAEVAVPLWKPLPLARKRVALALCLAAVGLAPIILGEMSNCNSPPLRRIGSFANTRDLSWANRLYTASTTLQAAMARPLTGWGWGKVLPVHNSVYKPTFMRENTAILLNDYIHLGATWGIPVALLLASIALWVIIQGRGMPSWPIVLCAGVAMFFQGVVRIPMLSLPTCVAAGLILGAHPPWRREQWRRLAVPWIPAAVAVGVLVIWIALPYARIPFAIRHTSDALVFTPKGFPGGPTVVWTTWEPVEKAGRLARAAASLGVRAAVVEGDADQARRLFGTNAWVVGGPLAQNGIPLASSGSPYSDASFAVDYVRAKTACVLKPSPDSPFPMESILAALWALALGVGVLAGFHFFRPAHWLPTAALILVLVAAIQSHWQRRARDNEDMADWARQMSKTDVPEDVFRRYVLDPEIEPGFRLSHRREVWFTFFQPSRGGNPSDQMAALRSAIRAQFLITPAGNSPRGDFETIWRERVVHEDQQEQLLAAVARAVGIPTRHTEKGMEIWGSGGWRETADPTQAAQSQPILRHGDEILGHYHIQTNKVDPGPAFDWERMVGAARRMSGEIEK